MQYCRLNEGTIDYKPIFAELNKFYEGYWTLEYEEPKDVEAETIDDLKILKSMLNRI